MRSKFLIVPVILLIQTFIHAQTFRAGMTVGLVATNINGMPSRYAGHFHKLGFTAGGLVNTQLGEKSSFQLELTFIQKGAQQKPDSNNMGYYKIALNYVEIPLILKRQIYFTKRGKPVNRFDLGFGASIGRMVFSNYYDQTNTLLPTSAGYFNKTDISILGEIDYNISRSVIFCLRYSNSVIPAVKRNAFNYQFITYTINRGNNMVLNFSFKFIFGRKKEEAPTPVKPQSEDDQ